MASNVHHHCLCHSSATAVTPSVCYCCSAVSHHPPPPDPHSIPPCFHTPQEHFNLCPTQIHHCRRSQCSPPPPPPPTQPIYQTGCYIQRVDPEPVVSSLLRRIAALESSLLRRRHHRSDSSSSSSARSLRDAAARTIQTHFRAFLVRRSRTLRHLKELAAIKSTLNILKSSNSDPLVLSRRAKQLLLTLDSIQGFDPMIRDGKKSIRSELIKFIKLTDVVSVESYDLSSRIVKQKKSRAQLLQDMEKMESIMNKYLELRKSVEEDDDEGEFESPRVSVVKPRKGGLAKRRGEVQPKVNKVVTFAEDDNVYRVSRRNLGQVEDSGSNANEELIENLVRRVEDLDVTLKEVEGDEEAESEDVGGSQGSSDGDSEPNYSLGKRLDQDDNGSFVFSAPLPVKMEGRADFSNGTKTVRFAD